MERSEAQDNVTKCDSAPAATAGEPDTYQMAGDVLDGKRRIEDVLAELRPAAPTGVEAERDADTPEEWLRAAEVMYPGEVPPRPVTMTALLVYGAKYQVRTLNDALTAQATALAALRSERDYLAERVEALEAQQSEHVSELAALRARVETALVAGNHLALVLDSRITDPAWNTWDRDTAQKILHRRTDMMWDVWVAWRVLMDVSEAIEPSAALAPRQPTEGHEHGNF